MAIPLKTLFYTFACTLWIGLTAPAAQADIVVDVDPGTPGPQTSFGVTSGTMLPITVWFDPFFAPIGASGPVAFNGVGIDINWGPGTGATAAPMSPMLGGTILGPAPGTDIITTGFPIGPGAPLATAGLPPAPPDIFSLGGAGYVDSSSSVFTYMGPVTMPENLLGADFLITGPVGSTVTFTASGILMPPMGSAPGAGPFMIGGDMLQAGIGVGPPTIPQLSFSGTITIIPEPSTFAFGLLGLALIGIRKRRSA